MAEIVIHNWEVSSPQESRHAKYDFQNSWPCEGRDGMVAFQFTRLDDASLTVPKESRTWQIEAGMQSACKKEAPTKSPNGAKSSFTPTNSFLRPPSQSQCPPARPIPSQTFQFQCGCCFLLPRWTRLVAALDNLRVENAALRKDYVYYSAYRRWDQKKSVIRPILGWSRFLYSKINRI